MFVVILKATVADLDQDYMEALEQMKKLAFEEYGCLEFTAMMDGNKRMALSYWESEEQIRKWKENSEHLNTQKIAKQRWYQSYSVQIAQITREYSFNT
ncbi:antibiotic biosynthesis monooxygenase [Oceanicoccus sp. KOV_DT_Chl]|uniref:antibiotic biosynthesis monooxygenase family protein n=1 Tax=Oceanicoccus sp. KOV_DT_Chl TaxID=1904639 RepID=UPI000C79AFC2|nr:antibiotic biosynthesis monooxygenase [Oceanicoccus sp. KOV_DT_Chl]